MRDGITGLTRWDSWCGKTSPVSQTWPRSRKRIRRTLPGNTQSEKDSIFRDCHIELCVCKVDGAAGKSSEHHPLGCLQ